MFLHQNRFRTGDQSRRGGMLGFTLLEALLALIIMAILLGLALPAWDSLLRSMREKAVVSAMERALRLTREEAILQQMPVRLCPSVNMEVCEGADWSTGWLAYVDVVGGESRDPEDPLITAHGPVEGLSIHYNRGRTISADARGRFRQNGTIRICALHRDNENRELVLLRTGRLRLTSSTRSCLWIGW